MKLLKKNLILLNVEAGTNEEALKIMADKFVETGVCKESYPGAIIEREKNYPTGLPAKAFDIALPHTFSEHVNEESMGICVLKHPVEFKMMGSPDTTLHPEILFMLGIIDPKQQISILKQIMKLIQDNDTLCKIRDAKTADEIYDLMSKVL